MQAEELQIGDLVRIEAFNRIVSVKEINSNSVMTSIGGPWMFDEISAIPITPEILEKNGFEHPSRSSYYDYDDGCGLLIRYDTWDKRLKIIRDLNIAYDSGDYADICVHTLQHVLRILKIEKEIVL